MSTFINLIFLAFMLMTCTVNSVIASCATRRHGIYLDHSVPAEESYLQ